MSHTPTVISVEDMPITDARWITLKKLKYIDQEGKQRDWECAQRKTRRSSGIDAVSILTILSSKTNAFPLSTVILEQYRPPIDKVVIEFPAGLIDEGETPEQAALRELTEETGYKSDQIVDVSPVVFADPGMTNANMKLVIIKVVMEGELETPEQNLETGEFIIKRVVEISKLNDELKAYDKKGFAVDARLAHFAEGYATALKVASGTFN